MAGITKLSVQRLESPRLRIPNLTGSATNPKLRSRDRNLWLKVLPFGFLSLEYGAEALKPRVWGQGCETKSSSLRVSGLDPKTKASIMILRLRLRLKITVQKS